MPLPAQHDALPLRLTPFEDLMLLVDRPRYPAAFLVESHLVGDLNREAFEAAVDDALERNPLLCSVVKGKGAKKRWEWAPDKRPTIDWCDFDSPVALPDGEFIDLTREVGTRIWVQCSAERATVIYQIHHACCDGIGFGQFVTDIVVGYAARTCTSETQPKLPEVDAQLLRGRADRQPRVGNATKALAIAAIAKISRILWNRPITMANGLTPASEDGDRQLFPHLRSCFFDKRTTRGLREAARLCDASLNDVLIRDMMLALYEWNDRHDALPPDQPIRILMPTSLRTTMDKTLPAANVVGFSFINRFASELSSADDSGLLREVAKDTKSILTENLGWTFTDAITAMHRWRLLFGMGWSVGRRPCSTAILANVGSLVNRIAHRVERKNGKLLMGDMMMESMACVPPLRPGVKVASTTYREAGCLIVNLRCDPYSISDPDAQAFVELYEDRLRRTAANAQPSNLQTVGS